jgi:hypothetical protein
MGDVFEDHHPGQSGALGQKREQARMGGVGQGGQPGGAQRRGLDERGPEGVEGERHPRGVEVAVVPGPAVRDQRVLRGRVEILGDGLFRVVQGVEDGAVDLREGAVAVGVLDVPRAGGPDQGAQPGRDRGLVRPALYGLRQRFE